MAQFRVYQDGWIIKQTNKQNKTKVKDVFVGGWPHFEVSYSQTSARKMNYSQPCVLFRFRIQHFPGGSQRGQF